MPPIYRVSSRSKTANAFSIVHTSMENLQTDLRTDFDRGNLPEHRHVVPTPDVVITDQVLDQSSALQDLRIANGELLQALAAPIQLLKPVDLATERAGTPARFTRSLGKAPIRADRHLSKRRVYAPKRLKPLRVTVRPYLGEDRPRSHPLGFVYRCARYVHVREMRGSRPSPPTIF